MGRPKKIKLDTPPIKNAAAYGITLKANNLEYQGEGDTVFDAVKSLGLHFTGFKTKGTLIIKKGENTYERFFPLPHLRRLFINPGVLKFISRQIEDYFKLKFG